MSDFLFDKIEPTKFELNSLIL